MPKFRNTLFQLRTYLPMKVEQSVPFSYSSVFYMPNFQKFCLFHLHRRLNSICQRFGTLWLFHLRTYLLMKTEQSVRKSWRIKFRSRGITQKKTYNIQNKAKFLNQGFLKFAKYCFCPHTAIKFDLNYLFTVNLHLFGRWLSGSPITRIGLPRQINLSRIPQNYSAVKLPVIGNSTIQCYGFQNFKSGVIERFRQRYIL